MSTSVTASTPTEVVVPPTTGSSSVPTTSLEDGPDTGRPVDDRWLTIEVGVAGTVELRLDANAAEPGDIAPRAGWSPSVTRSPSGQLDVVFTDGQSQASLRVWSEPGRFSLEVDHGAAWPSRREWTRTYSIGPTGTVDVIYGDHGLSGLDVRLSGDWQHRVDTIGPDHLSVEILDPTMRGRWEDRVEAGPATVDLLITGS